MLCITFIVVFAGHGAAQTGAPTLEHQVKASLFYNFLSYIEWPEDTYATHPETFHLCVIAEESFRPALESVAGEIVQGRRLELEMSSSVDLEALESCNALYLGRAMSHTAASVLQYIDELPVLTVSDIPGFLELGGVIEFARIGTKIRFKVNLDSAKRSRLVISSHVLRLAEQVVQ